MPPSVREACTLHAPSLCNATGKRLKILYVCSWMCVRVRVCTYMSHSMGNWLKGSVIILDKDMLWWCLTQSDCWMLFISCAVSGHSYVCFYLSKWKMWWIVWNSYHRVLDKGELTYLFVFIWRARARVCVFNSMSPVILLATLSWFSMWTSIFFFNMLCKCTFCRHYFTDSVIPEQFTGMPVLCSQFSQFTY